MALNSKKAEKSKVVTCVSGNMPRPMSIGSDLSDAGKKHCYFLKIVCFKLFIIFIDFEIFIGSDISMEKMQITDEEK